MRKSKYSKDNLYLRALEKEKTQLRIKESNKKMRRITDQSKERIKEFQRLRNENHYNLESSFSPSKIRKSFHDSENSSHSDPDSYFRNKMMQPISSKANEYEKAIQQFLGVNHSEIQIEKLKKAKKNKTPPEFIPPRPRSSFEMNREGVNRGNFNDELRKIELQEKNLQKHLRELNSKQKSVKVNSKSFNSPIKSKQNTNVDLFKSLEQVNQLLTNFLKSPAVKAGLNKKK